MGVILMEKKAMQRKKEEKVIIPQSQVIKDKEKCLYHLFSNLAI
ncbi:MAG: hypothetical protein K0S80_3574 [Neobacillus sp.]|nr:hypothetical protein [Neobacillus sp.]